MSDFVTSLRTISTSAETTPGTPVGLASGNDNRAWDLAINSLDVPMDESPSKYATGDMFNGESIPGNQSAKISWRTKFHGEGDGTSAAAGTEPKFTKFFKAAGCNVVSAVSASYAGYEIYPDLTKTESTLTVGIYDKSRASNPVGLFYQFVGAIGNFVISTEGTGKPYNCAWEFTGGLNDITDIASSAIPALTDASTRIPDRFIDGVATIGTFSACISTMEFNAGNEIGAVECIGADSGYEKFGIIAQNPSLTINPKLMSESDYDAWSKFIAGTVEAVTIQTTEFKLYIPRAQITAFNVEDSEGIVRTPITFSPLRNTSDVHGFAPWVLTIINWNA